MKCMFSYWDSTSGLAWCMYGAPVLIEEVTNMNSNSRGISMLSVFG